MIKVNFSETTREGKVVSKGIVTVTDIYINEETGNFSFLIVGLGEKTIPFENITSLIHTGDDMVITFLAGESYHTVVVNRELDPEMIISDYMNYSNIKF